MSSKYTNDLVSQVVENLSIVIYSMNQQGKHLYINQQCADFTGYLPEDFLSNSALWLDCVYEEDKPCYEEHMAKLTEAGTTEVEYRFICKEGTIKWFKDKATAVLNDTGVLVRIDGLIQDISVHRAVVEELKLTRSAINSAYNGIIIVDAQQPNMPIIFANHAFEQLTGYKLDEVIGKNCRILQKSDRKQEPLAKIRKAIQGSTKANVILRNYKKNGELFYNHIYISPIKDERGLVTHYVGVQYDVTEKIALEKQLKAYYEKEKYLRYIMASIADLNKLIGTAKSQTALFRSACQRMINIYPYQYVWFGLMGHDGFDKEYAMGNGEISASVKKKYLHDIHKRINQNADGIQLTRGKHTVLGQWVCIPMAYQMKPETVFGYLVIYTNMETGFVDEEITMLQDLSTTISGAIEYQKIDQLMFFQARQLAMGELIGQMAHQWRQPINEVGLILQDLRDAFLNNELDEGYIVNSSREGMELLQKMSGTIDDFRRFFTDSQKISFFRVRDVIQECVDLIKPYLGIPSMVISIHEAENIQVMGYPKEFAQVVLNLLNNAKDAIARSNPVEPRITIHIEQQHRLAVITMEDNGGGIPEHAMDHIFEQYYSTKKNHQGAGLGLYISKMIVENGMKGRLWAENKEEGVKFTVEVPNDEH